MSELLWVAVPNGLIPDAGGGIPTQACIRVLVVPRLTGVDIGEDGLQDWPALAADTSFTLWTKTSLGVHVAAHRPRYVARARSEVWTGFFGGDAGLVDPYVPKTNPVPAVAPSYSDAHDVAKDYRAVSRVAAVPAADADAKIRSTLTGWDTPDPPRPTMPTDPPSLGTPDFHATVSRLREHPTVLLDLGLVFEVIVNVADLAVGDAAAGRQLSIRCDDPPPLVGLVTAPWTRYDLDLTPPVTGFRPAPGSSNSIGIGNGLLDLSGTTSITAPTAPGADMARWAVATFDIDGVVGNLRQHARALAADPETHATMPPMRSIGLALLRPDRALDVAERVRAAQHRAELDVAETTFGAEDLVLGYRVDIRQGGGPWLSLCERDAQYTIADLPIGPTTPGRVREEGHVKAFAALRDADGGLHTDGVVLRWGGWSAVVPLPNLRGDTVGPTPAPSTPLPYRFSLDFAIPAGRLPALRFSSVYRMRIRIADLAGGGLGLGDLGGNQAATEPIIYGRHDPIQPPRLTGTGPFAPGAAIDRMVVRSDKNLTPEQLHAIDPDYPLVETRTLAPPTTSLQVVEQHGMLDAPLTDEQSFALVQRAMAADGSDAGLADPAAEGVNAVVRAEPGGLAHEISDDEAWSPRWPGAQPKSIELRPHVNQPDPITIGWSANTLQVTLGKAELATIELSSTIPGDMLDHLAVTDYLTGTDHVTDPTIPPAQTLLGRNPVVTPPRRVLVVHAVRTPLAEPKWNLPADAVERKEGATEVVLTPTFTAADSGFGLHTDSTGRLEVAASWTEVEDVGEQAVIGRRPVAISPLHSQAIDRGDPPPVRIRHEFGDTKHRTMTYIVKATSRFREYFKAGEPEELFQGSHTQDTLNLLSTVRPPVPVVLGVMPAFAWQRSRPAADRIEHTRRAQRLRVELARPWFQTGAGEQLAVVLAPGDDTPAAGSEWVTRVGRDPLFATPATGPRPTPAWFANAAAAQQVTPIDLSTPVTVIPVDVTPASDRWYADVEFTVPVAAASYNPFVRLAVARYQRDSFDELQLSPIVVTDTVPLLPDRHVTLTRTGTQVRIEVDGLSPNPRNRFEAILESCGPGITPEDLEVAVDDAATEPQLSAWRPVPGGSVVRGADGSIPPVTLGPTPGRLRLRLRETENLPGVDATSSPDLVQRNVFVDTIVLPGEWVPQ
ncbi:hypothetical protein ACFXPR_15625 [Nocardia tengchongensis]|uniref:hypothetical protein n=1 Tax=Nocardia tengchongensis TaxID=2055889 RepID=UPI003681AC0C